MHRCRICERLFQSDERLHDHARPRVLLKCDLNGCKRPASNRCALEFHQSRAHGRSLSCDICETEISAFETSAHQHLAETVETTSKAPPTNEPIGPCGGDPTFTPRVTTADQQRGLEVATFKAPLRQAEGKATQSEASRESISGPSGLRGGETSITAAVESRNHLVDLESSTCDTNARQTLEKATKRDANGETSNKACDLTGNEGLVTSAISESSLRNLETAPDFTAQHHVKECLHGQGGLQPIRERNGLRGDAVPFAPPTEVESKSEQAGLRVSEANPSTTEGLASTPVPVHFSCGGVDCMETFGTLRAWCDHQRETVHCYCQHCLSFLPSESERDAHIKTFHRIACVVCNEKFPTQSEVDKHRRQSAHAYCCRALFDDKSALTEHDLVQHSHKCSTCGVVLRSRTLLIEHRYQKGHRACNGCERLFSSEEATTSHSDFEHMSTCDTCEKQFRGNSPLYEHQRATLHCYCNMCMLHFATHEKDTEHYEKYHPFRCGEATCRRYFKTENGYRNHRRTSGHLYCEACDEYFETNADSAKHDFDIHTQKFHCGACNRIFYSEDAIRAHLEDAPVHRLRGGLYCPSCNRTFKYLRSLSSHVQRQH